MWFISSTSCATTEVATQTRFHGCLNTTQWRNCRYTVQNAQALREAKSALVTGEIKTPSVCSQWTSESAGSKEENLQGIGSKKRSTASSSGEEYVVGKSETNNGQSSEDSEDADSRGSPRSTSEEIFDSDDYTSTEEETDTEDTWEPADSSTSADSSSASDNPKVSIMLLIRFCITNRHVAYVCRARTGCIGKVFPCAME